MADGNSRSKKRRAKNKQDTHWCKVHRHNQIHLVGSEDGMTLEINPLKLAAQAQAVSKVMTDSQNSRVTLTKCTTSFCQARSEEIVLSSG